MYSKTWAHGVVTEYLERHARVTEAVLKHYDFYPKVLVDFLAKNSPEWEGFKFIIKQVELATQSTLTSTDLSTILTNIFAIIHQFPPSRLLTGLETWKILNLHSREGRRPSPRETGPAAAGLSRREAAEKAAAVQVASDFLGVDEARCL